MLTINTNMGAQIASNQLSKLNDQSLDLQKQATTGKRINSASDDAAGMAIATGMKMEIRGNEAAMSNISRGQDLLSTQEGTMSSIKDMLERMKTLAVSSSDGTLSATDRTTNNQELQDIMLEVDRLANSSEYNGKKLLDGSSATINLQIGSGTGAEDKLSLSMHNATIASMSINAGDVSTEASAQTFLDNLELDITALNTSFSTVGAYSNRLDYASDNLINMNENLSSSLSNIEDVDMAKLATEQAMNQVKQQLSYNALGMANQNQQSILSLFR